MDDMTNYIVTGLIYLAIWAIGAVYIHYTGPDTLVYMSWLKWWAIGAPFATIAISLLLGIAFPPPEFENISNITDLTKLTG